MAAPAEAGKLRILVVSNLYPPTVIGGAEIVAARQASALAKKGHDVTVFCGDFATEKKPPGFLFIDGDADFPVYRYSLKSLEPSHNFFDNEAGAKFRALVGRFQPHIVHFHNVMGLGANLLPIARSFDCRIVLTAHDHWTSCFKQTFQRNDGQLCADREDCALCRPSIDIEPQDSGEAVPDKEELPIRLRRDYVAWCLRSVDRFISPSRYLATTLDTQGGGPVAIVSNGIPLDVGPSRARTLADDVHLVSIGSLGEHKGIATLLDALARLAHDELACSWRFTIAGRGVFEDRIRRAVETGDLGPNISFVGHLEHDEVLALLARANVLVLASHWPENEPVILLEAIEAGLATIATRIGGNVELVEHGTTGWLVEPNDVDDLHAAMRRLIEDRELTTRFGEANRARCSKFNETASIAALETLYRTIERRDRIAEPPILVICGGGVPRGGTMRTLQLMLHRFHIVERDHPRFRFVWHAWDDDALWSEARLLWLWPGDGEACEALAKRALGAGVAILAPSMSAVASLHNRNRAVKTYETWLDALGAIASLQDELPKTLQDAMPQASKSMSCTGSADLEHSRISSSEVQSATHRSPSISPVGFDDARIGSHPAARPPNHVDGRISPRPKTPSVCGYGDLFAKRDRITSLFLTDPFGSRQPSPPTLEGNGKLQERQRMQSLLRTLTPDVPGSAIGRLFARWALRRRIALLRRSGLFDASWYLARNPDVDRAGLSPELHFLQHGSFEGRAPGPRFDPLQYLIDHDDVRSGRCEPWLHYARYGAREGRTIQSAV